MSGVPIHAGRRVLGVRALGFMTFDQNPWSQSHSVRTLKAMRLWGRGCGRRGAAVAAVHRLPGVLGADGAAVGGPGAGGRPGRRPPGPAVRGGRDVHGPPATAALPRAGPLLSAAQRGGRGCQVRLDSEP